MTENIIITEKEILDNPNNFELGQLVRTKYFKSNNFEKCPICGAEKKNALLKKKILKKICRYQK